MTPAGKKFQDTIAREIATLTDAVGKMASRLKQIQKPLQESSQQVPLATSKLDEISEQTEAVTHRMLDSVENITRREEEVLAGLDELYREIGPDQKPRVEKLIDSLRKRANQNLDEVSAILESLQFQDITAQQLNHAASTLETVENRLRELMQLTGATESATPLSESGRIRIYDPEAEMSDSRADQEQIDSIFSRKN